MCDFRIIKKIKLTETNEEIDIEEPFSISYYDYYNNFSKEREKGLYYLQITGTHRAYWNGEGWIEENGSLKYECDINNKYITHSYIKNGFDIIEIEPNHSHDPY